MFEPVRYDSPSGWVPHIPSPNADFRTLLLIEPHEVFGEGLSVLLTETREFRVAWLRSLDGLDAVARDRREFDIVLVGARAYSGEPAATVTRVRELFPAAAVAVMGVGDGDAAGADAYLSKTVSPAELLGTIRDMRRKGEGP